MKRVMVSVVGAGLGSLLGLVGSFLGGGSPVVIIGGVAGAVLPHVILGKPPGRDRLLPRRPSWL